MDELIDQARLSYTRLSDDGHHLAMPRPGPLECLLQRRQLLLPSHEAREPARRAGLQASAHGTSPHELKDLHGLWQAFDRKSSQRVDLDQPFRQSEGGCGQPDTAWG